MQETGTRINKYMSQCGYCSRREADRLIEKGEVWINGTLATMGTKVMPGDTVMVHHTTITPCQKEYLLAFRLKMVLLIHPALLRTPIMMNLSASL